MPLAPRPAEEHKTMKQPCIATLRWLGILGCMMLVAGSLYAQTTGSPGGAANKAGSEKTLPVINPGSTERPAPAPAPAPSPAPAQNPSANEATVCGVEVRNPKGAPKEKEVALGKFVILKLDKPWATLVKPTPTNKLGLFINDLFMKGLEPMPMPEHPEWVMFQLERNSDNQEAWGELFRRKNFFFGSRENEQLALTIGLQDGSWGAKNPQHVLYLEYFPDWRSWLVLLISGIVAALTIYFGAKSPTMLRDSGDPCTDGKKATYSLGRFQMALWFVTVVFAFLFAYAVTGDTSPIPQGTLVLMGIGAGTAVGAPASHLNHKTPFLPT